MSEQSLPDRDVIAQLINEGRIDELQDLLAEYHPADIAELLDELDPDTAVVLFTMLPLDVASEVLDESGGIMRKELLEQTDDERLADLLDEMPMDDAAEILEDLPDLMTDHLLGLMEPGEAADVRRILSYEENTAGRLMNTDVASLRRQWTSAEAIEYLRSLEEIETLHYLYVVDRDQKLIGVVPIRYLLLAQPDELIEEVMLQSVFSISVNSDQEDLAEFIAKYDYTAIPVVDDDGCLLGVVTVDDALDVLEEEATEDFHRLGGSEPLDQPYFAVSPFNIFRKRIGWLLLLFFAGSLTGYITTLFEGVWGVFTALTIFVPLVIGTGGNAGSQTIATIIRAITLGEVKVMTLGRAWRKEVATGLMLGFVMFALAMVLNFVVWRVELGVALAVALTMPVVVVWANTIGTIVPVLADRFGIDPTVISGPMITTLVDATGLAIYYTLAGYMLGVF